MLGRFDVAVQAINLSDGNVRQPYRNIKLLDGSIQLIHYDNRGITLESLQLLTSICNLEIAIELIHDLIFAVGGTPK